MPLSINVQDNVQLLVIIIIIILCSIAVRDAGMIISRQTGIRGNYSVLGHVGRISGSRAQVTDTTMFRAGSHVIRVPVEIIGQNTWIAMDSI